MKKIFLTSGLVLCMACPAFAAGFGDTTGLQEGQCDIGHLGTATDGANVTLTALWTDAIHTITLNAKPQDNQNAYIYGSASTSTVSPGVIYRDSVGVYASRTPINGTNPTEYEYSTALSNGDNVVAAASTPIGAPVTLTFNVNYAAVNALNAGDDYTNQISAVTPGESNRVFAGFFATTDTSGTNPLINASGNITTAGLGVSDTDQTWEAHYSCAPFTHENQPSLLGYTFEGWAANSDGTGTPNWCYDSNTTVYATWSANKHSVTYVCPQPGTVAQSGTVPTAASNVAYDSQYTVAANTCAFQGWTFTGWNCDYNLTGSSHEVGSTDAEKVAQAKANVQPGQALFHTDHNLTCYATWRRNNINLAWQDGTDANGGNTVEGAESCQYEDGITLPAKPTRPGYTFTGWSATVQQ